MLLPGGNQPLGGETLHPAPVFISVTVSVTSPLVPAPIYSPTVALLNDSLPPGQGQGGTGPSGTQCLKQNVRERKKPAARPWERCLGKKQDAWPCGGEPRPGGPGGLQGAGEGNRGVPASCSWASASHSFGGSGGREARGQRSGHALIPDMSSLSPAVAQTVQLWWVETAWGLLPRRAPCGCLTVYHPLVADRALPS